MKKSKIKTNSKGFTLVELLVAITIMGIILAIAIPQVSNLQNSNRTTQYEKYGESLITSAKLYTDSYSKDMFGYNTSGCYNISYYDLENKNLAKDIKVNDTNCDTYGPDGTTPLTYVKVLKSNDNYMYELAIKCVDKSNNVVYEKTVAGDGICDGTTTDQDGPGISFTPNGREWYQGYKPGTTTPDVVTIKVSDDYGLAENAKIKYAWTTTPASVPESSFKTLDFKNNRYEGTTSSPLKETVTVPQGVTGTYYLVVVPVQLKDANGNYFTDTVVSNPFKLDNTPPTCDSTTDNSTWTRSNVTVKIGCGDQAAGSGCSQAEFSSTYSSGLVRTSSVQISDAAGNTANCPVNVYLDKENPTQPTAGSIGTVSGSSTTGSIKTAASGSSDGNGSGLKEYRYLVTNSSTTPTDKTKFTTSLNFTRACGTSYYAWAIAVDNVGNMSSVKALGSTSDGKNEYSSWGSCTKSCGTGTQTRTNTCALVTTGLSQNCNTQDCCSKTEFSHYGDWGSCSVTCGGGTRYRDIHLKSSYDGSACGTSPTQDSESCNTHACEVPVNKNQYDPDCNMYYITVCGTTTCKYTAKNGAAEEGTIDISLLSDSPDASCNKTYCSAYIMYASGTTVNFQVTNLAKCKITNYGVGSGSCSKGSKSGDYSFNIGYSGQAVSTSSGCGIFVNTADVAYLYQGKEYNQVSWITYRCESNKFCTSGCDRVCVSS